MKPIGWIALLGVAGAGIGYAIYDTQKRKSVAALLPSVVRPTDMPPVPVAKPIAPSPSIVQQVAEGATVVAKAIPAIGAALGLGTVEAGTVAGTAVATASPAVVGTAVESSLVAAGAVPEAAAAAGAAATEAAASATAAGATATEAAGAGIVAGSGLVAITAGLIAPLALIAIVNNAIGTEPTITNAAAYNEPLFDSGVLKRGGGSSNILYDQSGNAQTTMPVNGLGRLAGTNPVVRNMILQLATELRKKPALAGIYR